MDREFVIVKTVEVGHTSYPLSLPFPPATQYLLLPSCSIWRETTACTRGPVHPSWHTTSAAKETGLKARRFWRYIVEKTVHRPPTEYRGMQY